MGQYVQNSKLSVVKSEILSTATSAIDETESTLISTVESVADSYATVYSTYSDLTDSTYSELQSNLDVNVSTLDSTVTSLYTSFSTTESLVESQVTALSTSRSAMTNMASNTDSDNILSAITSNRVRKIHSHLVLPAINFSLVTSTLSAAEAGGSLDATGVGTVHSSTPFVELVSEVAPASPVTNALYLEASLPVVTGTHLSTLASSFGVSVVSYRYENLRLHGALSVLNSSDGDVELAAIVHVSSASAASIASTGITVSGGASTVAIFNDDVGFNFEPDGSLASDYRTTVKATVSVIVAAGAGSYGIYGYKGGYLSGDLVLEVA